MGKQIFFFYLLLLFFSKLPNSLKHAYPALLIADTIFQVFMFLLALSQWDRLRCFIVALSGHIKYNE